MTRFQIILSPERNPDAHEILSPHRVGFGGSKPDWQTC